MKKLLLIAVLAILSGCKTIVYTTDDIYYSRPGYPHPVVVNNNPKPSPKLFIHHRRPQPRVVVITPRRTNLETYRRQHHNPKHK